MKKIIISLAALLLMAACSPSLNMGLGTVISSGSDGFFNENLLYSMGANELSFNTDGTFLFSSSDYEFNSDLNGNGSTNEGWVTVSGDRGTYTYQNEGYLLTLTYNATYRDPGSGLLLWDALTNDTDRVFIKVNAVFTENMPYVEGSVSLSAGNNSWTNYRLYRKYSGIYEVTRGTITIDVDNATQQFLTVTYNYSNDNVQYDGSQGLSLHTIENTFPEDEPWRTGSTLNFVTIRTIRYSGMTYSAGNWGTYTSTNTTPSSQETIFSHGGDFINAGTINWSL